MKLRKHATSLLLVALAGGLGLYVYLEESRSNFDVDRRVRSRNVFPSYRPETLEAIELVQGIETLRLERKDSSDGKEGKWFLRAPAPTEADPAEVNKLVRAFEFAIRVRTVKETDARGLASPRVRGMLTMGKHVYRFALGDPAPMPEGGAYFQLEGEGIFVVEPDLVLQLLQPAETYRERTVAAVRLTELSRIELSQEAEQVTLERTHSSSFFVAPQGVRASSERLEHVESALAALRVDTFVQGPAAEQARAQPLLKVRLVPIDSSSSPVELLVGGDCANQVGQRLIVRTQPTYLSGCVKQETLNAFSLPRDKWLDRRLFRARADAIEEVKFEDLGTGERLEMARKGDGWHLRIPENRDLTEEEADAATDWVQTLAGSEAADIAKQKASSAEKFASVRLQISVSTQEGEERVEVNSFDEASTQAEEILVRRNMDGALLAVPSQVARSLKQLFRLKKSK